MDLKSCPFCGGAAERLKKCVQCKGCGAQGPYTEEDCERDWNGRDITQDIKSYQDNVIDLETKLETMAKELGRAYRALHGFYAAYASGELPSKATVAYHSMTIAASARFVNHGALDGADYFDGKTVDVLHDALKPQ